MSPLDATNASFIIGFIVFVSSFQDTASQYGKRRNISVSHLRYSANHNALDSWPIRAHLASQNDELCKNRRLSFRKAEHRGATIMYSIWEIMCFFYLKPHKHIAFHQIHKIMFFLKTSYDPFKPASITWKSASVRFDVCYNENGIIFVHIWCFFLSFPLPRAEHNTTASFLMG